MQLKEKIDERKKKLSAFGLTLQPIPIIVGSSLDEITNCYVLVDDHMYEVPTPLKAVDLCFKTIHSQHLLYSAEAEQVWMLIQIGIYNIHTQWDKNYTSVNTLLSSLGCIQQ